MVCERTAGSGIILLEAQGKIILFNITGCVKYHKTKRLFLCFEESLYFTIPFIRN